MSAPILHPLREEELNRRAGERAGRKGAEGKGRAADPTQRARRDGEDEVKTGEESA